MTRFALTRQRRTLTDARRQLIGCTAAVCLSLACFGAPAWAGTTYVDGISDQSLMSWAGGFAEAASPDATFSSFFDTAWIGSPPFHVKLARYVVQWNVMSGAGYPEELADLQRWYAHAVELRLTPELALDNYNCDGCDPPHSTAEYARALEALYSSFPGIRVLEAWNEPNDTHYSSYLDPAAAAGLMNAAYAFCSERGCTVIAADLLDSEPNLLEYERQYERGLQPPDPVNWGLHPYHAVKYGTARTVSEFRRALPDPSTDRIWFTEVGAYYCENGRTYGQISQEQQARFLVERLMPEFQPAHVFYYELAWRYDEPPPCNSQQDDTALYAASSTNGPLSARPAASVIFGSEVVPTNSEPPPQASPRTPTLACEPLLDEQWPHGECPTSEEILAE